MCGGGGGAGGHWESGGSLWGRNCIHASEWPQALQPSLLRAQVPWFLNGYPWKPVGGLCHVLPIRGYALQLHSCWRVSYSQMCPPEVQVWAMRHSFAGASDSGPGTLEWGGGYWPMNQTVFGSDSCRSLCRYIRQTGTRCWVPCKWSWIWPLYPDTKLTFGDGVLGEVEKIALLLCQGEEVTTC